ncbi:MAG: thio:disulfide interchange protein [Hyphomonadaceae bacterium]|nr:MAG: thio:disulfide interchange protein [Hyphomonadaceae bacterium]
MDMQRQLRKLFSLCLFFVLALCPQIAAAQMPSSNNVNVSLISERETVRAGEVFHIALVQEIAPDWHTYWRNPGDVGDATRIEWTAPSGVMIGPIKWPTPSQIPYGDFVNYGYSERAIFPIEVRIPQNHALGSVELSAKVDWLECKDICIPGSSELKIIVKIGEASVPSANASEIQAALNALPSLFAGRAAISDTGNSLQIGFAGDAAKGAKSAYFYPYEISGGAFIDHAAEQSLEFGQNGFSLSLKKSPSIPKSLPAEIGGVVVIEKNGTQTALEILAPFGEFMAGVSGQKPSAAIDWRGLITASLAAFLGGLILNLMPCVFPILAMKIFGLTKIAHGNPSVARKYGIHYAIGVITTFSILGGVIYAIKASGQSIGWGFQLQDPSFLFIMAIVISALGLNLLGLFEFGGLQNLGSRFTQKPGNLGAFFSGTLAVAVASPCTAPFMGAALGFAATQSALVGMAVFVSLGIGFAFPFAALTFAPNALKFLPKPGPWMEKLKQILAIPMFLTAAWLIWVLGKISGVLGIYLAIGTISLLLLWRIARTQNRPKIIKIAAATGFIFLTIFSLLGFNLGHRAVDMKQNNANAWSEAAVQSAIGQGKTVFVNFTADWCITCKANEKLVFENPRVRRAMTKSNVVYLVADWTNRNDEITRALSSHGRLGVPLYLIYKPSASEPIVLPQILTPDAVVDGIG